MLAFGVAQLVDSIRKGEIVHFAKAAIFIIVSGLIGVGTGASNLLTTLEYKESTMQGQKNQVPAHGTPENPNPTAERSWS